MKGERDRLEQVRLEEERRKRAQGKRNFGGNENENTSKNENLTYKQESVKFTIKFKWQTQAWIKAHVSLQL